MDPEAELSPEMAERLADVLARLGAAKAMRPANQPMPGYVPPDPAILTSFIERLGRATPPILVYEASSIRGALPLPDFGAETPSQEHLQIYEQIAELRASLQALCDKAVVSGYRPLKALPVPAKDVSEELQQIKVAIEAIAGEVERLGRPDLSGISLPLGPVSVDLKAIDAVLSRFLRQLRRDRSEVDAAAIWATTEELSRISLALYVQLETLNWELADRTRDFVAKVRGLIAEITVAANAILTKALKHQARKIADRVTSRTARASKVLPCDLAMDLGTSALRIYLRGKGIVFSEPSTVVFHRDGRTLDVEAYGHQAAPMVGKTPYGVQVGSFMTRGGIGDEILAEKVLGAMVRKTGVTGLFSRPRAVVPVPSRGPETHRRAIRTVLAKIGFPKVSLVDRALAAALGAKLPVGDSRPSLVVDVGAGSTDMAIFANNTQIGARTVQLGGDDIDEALLLHIRTNYSLLINHLAVGKMKAEFFAAENVGEIDVTGRDFNQGVPRSARVRRANFLQAPHSICRRIGEGVRDLVETAPASVRSRIEVVTLTGGGAMLSTISEQVAAETGLPVVWAEEPLACTILGCGRFTEPDAEAAAAWAARSSDLD